MVNTAWQNDQVYNFFAESPFFVLCPLEAVVVKDVKAVVVETD